MVVLFFRLECCRHLANINNRITNVLPQHCSHCSTSYLISVCLIVLICKMGRPAFFWQDDKEELNEITDGPLKRDTVVLVVIVITIW